MERFFAIFRLGTKYLYRYKRRYVFLITALVLGFMVVTFITSTKDGMYDNAYYTAQSHYAGDIVALLYSSSPERDSNRVVGNEISTILNAALAAGINPKHTILRTMLFQGGTVHYNGNAVQLRYVIGCDWKNEDFLFNKMDFEDSSGSFAGEDGIVLSLPVAQLLGAKTGDRVILETETPGGQKNTAFFIVTKITKDVSFFGYYKAYISRLSLNRLLVYEDEACSSIGFFLDDPDKAEQKRDALRNVLSKQMQTGPLIHHRDEIETARKQITEGDAVFLYTLPVYLSEISDLLDTMNIITYFLYGTMLIIIFVSANVTYRLILHERAREIGIMRAIGFHGRDMGLVLWTEIIVLGIISMIAGFVLANILSWAVSLHSFSWFPGFEIFMHNGKLRPLYLPSTLLINIVLILIILLVLAFFPSFRVTRKELPQLLSGEFI